MPRGKQTKNYAEEESTALCAEVQHILPISQNDWERVASRFALTAKENGWPVRDRDSVKRKFGILSTSKKPTG